jgi:hypothetical protein
MSIFKDAELWEMVKNESRTVWNMLDAQAKEMSRLWQTAYDARNAQGVSYPAVAIGANYNLDANEIISRFNELYALLDVQRVNSQPSQPRLERLGTVHTEVKFEPVTGKHQFNAGVRTAKELVQCLKFIPCVTCTNLRPKGYCHACEINSKNIEILKSMIE